MGKYEQLQHFSGETEVSGTEDLHSHVSSIFSPFLTILRSFFGTVHSVNLDVNLLYKSGLRYTQVSHRKWTDGYILPLTW